jgi:putative sigma-54 modulation protein
MNIEITGIHFTASDRLKAYVEKKMHSLDKYIARAGRDVVLVKVRLIESKAADKKEYTCEVHMTLPHDVIEAKDSTLNMFAAVDIVEAKLKTQLKKYKELHHNPKLHQRLMTRFKHRPEAA